MTFVKGNNFWEYRKKHGRERIFKSAEELLDAANKYFIWVDENPLKKSEIVKYKDYAELMEVPICRPYTKEGLADFLQVSQYRTISDYKNKGNDSSQVITHIENVIYKQKFENAAANLLNANIIARDLGLSDKQEIDQKNTGKIIFQNVSDKFKVDENGNATEIE